MTDQKITIRRGTIDDVPAIQALTHAAYEKWVPVINRAPKPMTADYDVAVRRHVIDLLFDGQELVALIEMIPAADHILIENLAVSPLCQGQGHGRRLMAHAEAFARETGKDRIELYTNQRFAENISFYQALGYTLDREEPFRGGVVTYLNKRL